MMSKILFFAFALSAPLWAQDASEEAIILNQELQFLEEAANNVSIPQISTDARTRQDRARPIDTRSLEEIYFGGDSDDVSTRAAAPGRKQRGL